MRSVEALFRRVDEIVIVVRIGALELLQHDGCEGARALRCRIASAPGGASRSMEPSEGVHRLQR